MHLCKSDDELKWANITFFTDVQWYENGVKFGDSAINPLNFRFSGYADAVIDIDTLVLVHWETALQMQPVLSILGICSTCVLLIQKDKTIVDIGLRSRCALHSHHPFLGR